ncbi:galactoside alpha-(1,2)-fucosyltransferase 2-like [Gigantopelta aegis]|uniref:galactoside alpha-(1,2)-fucosyltransferase 2-like n=1 Tax=Gigantopelta aegis TaxID=1735272 RepID=UPI001B889244|nr:galactoside alpha-(1,2)-fucosyltransferase 2-like [Gigantopelta aegis]
MMKKLLGPALKCGLIIGIIGLAVHVHIWNWGALTSGRRELHVAERDNRLPGVINTKNNRQSPYYVKDKKTQARFANDDTFYLATNIISGVGLGNFMYGYASVVGVANSRDMTVALQANHPLRQIFHLEEKVLPDANMFKTFERVTSEKCSRYDKMFLEMPRNRNYTIDNLLQSWKYFSHVESNIRHQLRFKDHIKSVAEKRIREIREKYQSKSQGEITLIGVHIRRGDKDSELARKTGNYVAPPEYIKNAMAYFVSRFSNCVFVVCSDTMTWVEKHVKTNTGMELISERNSPEVDMAILSLCNHTIMTVGTFGWWGGYLAGGTVLYYKNPYDEKDQFWSKVFNKADYFPPHWIPML